jgi:hypothetical protein
MSLDEMIRFLRAIDHPLNADLPRGALFNIEITVWEKKHRPED